MARLNTLSRGWCPRHDRRHGTTRAKPHGERGIGDAKDDTKSNERGHDADVVGEKPDRDARQPQAEVRTEKVAGHRPRPLRPPATLTADSPPRYVKP